METKLTKVIIDGRELEVTDKQAQQMLEVLSGKMDSLENEITALREEFDWCELD